MTPLELRARRRRLRTPSDARRDRPRPAAPRTASTPTACSPGWPPARSRASRSRHVATPSPAPSRSPGGPAWFELRLDGAARVRLRARLTHLGDLSTLVTRARRLFDLDADPIAIDEALSRHPALRPLVAATPGIRVPGAADPHEMLIRAMVGQQITVAAARTALTALAACAGGAGGGLRRHRPAVPDDGGDRRARSRGAARTRRPHPGDHGRRGRAGLRRARAGRRRRRRRRSARRCWRAPASGRGPRTTSACACSAIPTSSSPAMSPSAPALPRAALPADPKPLTEWAARTAPWRSYLTAHLWRAAPIARRSRPSNRRHAHDHHTHPDPRHPGRRVHDRRRRPAARARFRLDRRPGRRPGPHSARLAPHAHAGGRDGCRGRRGRVLRRRPARHRRRRGLRRAAPPCSCTGWAALREIVPGHPLTYTEFAAALGQPAAVRAAASICARNAPALFVPCHRVLRSDGSLGGFAWGLEVKDRLLARERAAA